MLNTKFKIPKNTDKFFWTKHAVEKMKFYGLTPQRVLRIIKLPERREESIVENCVACMQSLGTKKKTEIWVMYQKNRRYPGVSPKNKMPVIPEDVWEGINE